MAEAADADRTRQQVPGLRTIEDYPLRMCRDAGRHLPHGNGESLCPGRWSAAENNRQTGGAGQLEDFAD
jgi:hypothetical protein